MTLATNYFTWPLIVCSVNLATSSNIYDDVNPLIIGFRLKNRTQFGQSLFEIALVYTYLLEDLCLCVNPEIL